MPDGLARLWAGWRSAYVSAAGESSDDDDDDDDDECVLCRVVAPDAPAVWRGRWCVAVLNAYPYISGHLMVLPTRHVGELNELTPDESTELWAGMQNGVVALRTAYSPGGVNVGMNLGRAAGAGVPGHLHAHVLPRWEGDTNFMTTVASARVLSEALPDTFAKLSAAWPADGDVGGGSADR